MKIIRTTNLPLTTQPQRQASNGKLYNQNVNLLIAQKVLQAFQKYIYDSSTLKYISRFSL